MIEKIIQGEKAYYRGGSTLKNLTSRSEKSLTGEEILLIFNTYGLAPRELTILLMSHGCDGDYNEFSKLLEEQEARMKNLKQCDVSDK